VPRGDWGYKTGLGHELWLSYAMENIWYVYRNSAIYSIHRNRNTRSITRRSKIWTRYPEFRAWTIRSTMRYRTPTSAATVFRPLRECTPMWRRAARPITCATMDARANRAPSSSAPMEPSSIRRNSPATGGTMSSARRPPISTSKLELHLLKIFCITIFTFPQLECRSRAQPLLSQEETWAGTLC